MFTSEHWQRLRAVSGSDLRFGGALLAGFALVLLLSVRFVGVWTSDQSYRVQAINSLVPDTFAHRNAETYDKNYHGITIEPDSGLARLYPGKSGGKVNSIHHQSVKTLGRDLVIEAWLETDRMIEAIRWKGRGYVLGIQWHPEFLLPGDQAMLDPTPILDEFLAAVRKKT